MLPFDPEYWPPNYIPATILKERGKIVLTACLCGWSGVGPKHCPDCDIDLEMLTQWWLRWHGGAAEVPMTVEELRADFEKYVVLSAEFVELRPD